MSADKFVGDVNRFPHQRIGVLMAELNRAKREVRRALIDLAAAHADGAYGILERLHADICETLVAIAKADGG